MRQNTLRSCVIIDLLKILLLLLLFIIIVISIVIN